MRHSTGSEDEPLLDIALERAEGWALGGPNNDEMTWRHGLLMVATLAARLPYLTSEFVLHNEWGGATWAFQADVFRRLGWFTGHGLVYHGVASGQPIVYPNHPPLATWLTALWFGIFGNSETSYRSMGILLSLISVLVVADLGRRWWDENTGLAAGLAYALTPLSILMGRAPYQEQMLLTFVVASCWCLQRWLGDEGRGWLLGAVFCLGAGSLCTLYTLFLCPYLLWRVFRDASRRPGWALLTVTPPAVVGLYLAYLYKLGYLELLRRGAGRYSEFLLFDPGFWGLEAGRLLWLTGGIVPLLALYQLVRPEKEQPPRVALNFLLALPVVDILVVPEMLRVHDWRLLYFGPPLALLAARGWTRLPRLPAISCAVLLALCCGYGGAAIYKIEHPQDPALGRFIHQNTSDDDLIIGLSFNVSYYARRRQLVPYLDFYASSKNQTPEQHFEHLRNFILKHPDFRRVVLFTHFLSVESGLDYSGLFEGHAQFERVSNPGDDVQIWRSLRSGGP